MGMKCVDEFADLCLSADQRTMVNNNVIGAQYTFRFLCDDEIFQKGKLSFLKILITYTTTNHCEPLYL